MRQTLLSYPYVFYCTLSLSLSSLPLLPRALRNFSISEFSIFRAAFAGCLPRSLGARLSVLASSHAIKQTHIVGQSHSPIELAHPLIGSD